MSQFFASGDRSIGVSASASVLRTDFLSDGLVESLCSPRDSQESSLTPQFKSINSSALSFLYPCPSVSSKLCPSSCDDDPAISFSATLFFCLQSFPASESFLMSQFFASGGQSIGVSASASALNEYSGLISFRMDWLDLLAVQGTL